MTSNEEALAARLDEDEAAAKAATDGPWYADGNEIRGHNRTYAGGESGILVVKHTWPQESAHIVRHDPARVLREVAAVRAILTEIKTGGGNTWSPDYYEGLNFALAALGEVYDDSPAQPGAATPPVAPAPGP